ncbi:DUF2326 domain-containing protein [Clostridium fermenticellae]|uniref:DUF2326 domain-containing protein n=1 Tax=Clostridium fermenticellae TaxID=2068654 RepID=A0A386H1I6_9CLOT|nr:DUF2326 domain-containing protein [Clostridium fermenticellae]AYD39423.1 DUF2326 domain-containing protein [Clostridium fermenticellae]
MLIEMSSPVFIEKGVVRPPIVFKEGLNVVLGREDGTNSIDKSSVLLAIDFVFGGNTYIASDGVKHIGDHTIFFTFKFEGKEYYFARNTASAEEVQICSKGYSLTGKVKTRQEFVDWLKKKYQMDFPGLSFRSTLSSFLRVYGKDNTNERKPLYGIPGDGMQKSIDRLVKLFDRYRDIEDFTSRLEEQKKKLSAYREARKYHFVSDLVGGKEKYDENLAEIHSLQVELDILTSERVSTCSEEDIEKNKLKSDLKDKKFRLEESIESKKRRLNLLDMSLSYGLYPTEADLSGLQEFFPDVNLRKLYEVEGYHKKLSTILDGQFAAEHESVQHEIENLQSQVESVEVQIRELGMVGNLSKEFLDRHSEIKGKIDALKTQNKAYLTLTDLQDARKKADDMLKGAIETILADIEQAINDKMKEYNDSLFLEPHKCPHLHFNEYNSYRFETPDDTGTGSNYKGMVIFDLAVLNLTALPAITHDSLILKNISDGSIDGIMKIYANSKKQIFIAFDKQDAYTPETRKIVSDNKILKLSNNHCELYGQSWNVEEAQNEDKL